MSDMYEFNQRVIAAFRANGGTVEGMEDAPLVLLTTRGARTAAPRATPVVALPDGDRLFVFASNAGADRHPARYHNLRAKPRVTVECGADRYAAIARVVRPDERDRIYARQAETRPEFAEYECNTRRRIPVVELVPAG